jgi:hypothetical protein
VNLVISLEGVRDASAGIVSENILPLLTVLVLSKLTNKLACLAPAVLGSWVILTYWIDSSALTPTIRVARRVKSVTTFDFIVYL